MCGQLVLYVGQTICTLKKRESQHRSKGNKTYSKYIPKDMEWEIKLLEECEDDIAITREQHYYDTLKPFYNKQRPGQTEKEYKKKYRQTEAYKQSQRESQRKYQQTEAYKESQREYHKRYRAAKKATESSA